eukprot:jgi/Bigna1/86568/estExt_fgenesh1_pg.C_110234
MANEGQEQEEEQPGLLLKSKSRAPSRVASRRVSGAPSPVARRNTIRDIKINEGLDSFSFPVFFRFFCYHFVFPLSIPFVLMLEGWAMASNLCFIPAWSDKKKLAVFVSQCVPAIAGYVMISLHIENENPPHSIFVVGAKYGSLEEETMQWLRSEVIERKILESIELLSWVNLDIAGIDHQLRYTAEKRGIEFKDMFFLINEEIYNESIVKAESSLVQNVIKFYEEKKEGQQDRSKNGKSTGHELQQRHHYKQDENHHHMVKVAMLPIATKTVSFSMQRELTYTQERWVLRACALVQGLIPICLQWIKNELDGTRSRSVASFTQVGIGFFMTVFFFYVALLFVDVGRLDYQRRAKVIRAAGALIDCETPFDAEKIGSYLFVDLAWPKNVAVWLNFRWLLLNLGSQFRNRIRLYTGLVSAFLIGLLMYMIIGIFLDNISEIVIGTTAGFLLFVGSSLARSIWYGSETNEQYGRQARRVTNIQFSLRELKAEIRQSSRSAFKKKIIDERLSAADDLMALAVKMLEHDSRLEPITVLGFRASKEMYTTIAFASVGAVLGIMLEFYINANG